MQEGEPEDRCINEIQELSTHCCETTPFKTVILLYLTYCHLTGHFCRASDKRKLEHTLERALRAVFRDSKSTYEEMLKKANLKSFYERRLQDIACLMLKSEA